MTKPFQYFFSALIVFLILAGNALAAPKLSYTLSTPNPQTHYFEVEMRLQDFKDKFIDVKMPVWAPGSYLVREFPKNVESFTAKAGSENIRTEKVDKNTWRIYSGKKSDLKVSYK